MKTPKLKKDSINESNLINMCKAVDWIFINLDGNLLEYKCKYGHVNKINKDIFIKNVKKDLKSMNGTVMYCFECHDGW